MRGFKHSYEHTFWFNQFSLGELIDALKHRPIEQDVYFDFAQAFPTSLASYRGFYENLAIGFAFHGGPEDHIPPTVEIFNRQLTAAIGHTFSGWKGGSYTMDVDTPLWVANSGDATSTIITGVADAEHETIIRTGWVSV
jgi:hypothetical protein